MISKAGQYSLLIAENLKALQTRITTVITTR